MHGLLLHICTNIGCKEHYHKLPHNEESGYNYVLLHKNIKMAVSVVNAFRIPHSCVWKGVGGRLNIGLG